MKTDNAMYGFSKEKEMKAVSVYEHLKLNQTAGPLKSALST